MPEVTQSFRSESADTEGNESAPGLRSESAPAPSSAVEHNETGWLEYGRIALAGVAVIAAWFHLWRPIERFDVIGLIATLVCGYPIFKEALADLVSLRMTMELSMTIALGAALAIGEVFTALLITFFVLIAEVLEEMNMDRGRRAIRELVDFLPLTADVRRPEGVRQAAMAQVRPGDLVVVRPGGRIPVDGAVVSGHSFVDQSAITGESLPVEKFADSMVFAGTINQSGVLEIRTETIGLDTAFGKIIQAVEHAEEHRAPVQKTADKLAGYLVYCALGCAALTFLLSRDIRATISVIIVAGACGVAAGTPLAILGAIGRSARNGAIIKGGLYLEQLGTVDTVVLDKTGTLTEGIPTVTRIQPWPGISPRELLYVAASAERFSEHPLGQAISRKAIELGAAADEPETFHYTPGKGIVCSLRGHDIVVGNRILLREKGIGPIAAGAQNGASEILVARDSRLLGAIFIADSLRSEAKGAVAFLKALGIRTVLLTGDSTAIAEAVARHLGVDSVEAELLPEAKLSRIRNLRAEGRKVAMVGDGINDAPALMAADVGVAMGSGTDVARESANIVLLGNDLLKLVEVVHIARRCRRIIMTNFAGTLVVDALGMGMAAFGLLNPVVAALVHVSSELVFILNSARLLPRLARSGHGGTSGPQPIDLA